MTFLRTKKKTKRKGHKVIQCRFPDQNSGLKGEKCTRRKVCNDDDDDDDNNNNNNNNSISCLFTFWLNSAQSVWRGTFCSITTMHTLQIVS